MVDVKVYATVIRAVPGKRHASPHDRAIASGLGWYSSLDLADSSQILEGGQSLHAKRLEPGFAARVVDRASSVTASARQFVT